MKWVKRLAIGCGGAVLVLVLLVAGLYVGGFALDPEVRLAAEGVVDAPVAEVRPLVGTADGVKRWWVAAAAAQGMPDSMDIVHAGGPAEGPGLVVTFGAGGQTMETWTLRELSDERAVWDVDFGVFTVERQLTLIAEGERTRVRWTEAGRIESPLARWMAVVMPPSMMEDNFRLAIQGMGQALDG